MLVEPKKKIGENKKALGLLSRGDECGWIRVLAEESGTGANGSGTPDEKNE